MRICRYRTSTGEPAYGLVEGDEVLELAGDPFGDAEPGSPVGPLDGVELLAPVRPSKVVCAGRNYRSLLVEQGRETPAEPFLFLKTANAVTGPGAPIWYPDGASDVAHEGELAVVIGAPASRLREEEAMGAVLGYAAANDVTVRDWQPAEQWWRAKSSDSHCPLGPWIETELANPHRVRVRTYVNDELRQDGSTDDLVFGIPALLAHITAHVSLVPGDVVLTGTAAGIRPIVPGDVVRVAADGVGELTNTVRKRKPE